ncbi:hypothetical protein Sjap_002665 [Stephania japonica]|uniref:Uncharacterized protein n=1 Tax=Stephania japonica TaxID=461633 RepID=A0AAP0PUC2_9MAGN
MGYIQGKLIDHFRPIDTDMSSLATSYSVKYTFDAQFWEDWEDNVISVERRGKKATYPSQVTDDYIDWFQSVSHPFACNPEFVGAVVHEEEPTLRNRHALDIALWYRSMLKSSVTSDNAFKMVDQVITYLSGAWDSS